MKKYNYLLGGLSLSIIIGMAAFLLGSQTVSTVERQPVVSSTTVSVPVPESVEFCGNKISLQRLDMRERFDREMNALTYLHSTTLLDFKRANRYFPIIEPILKRNNIPDDFKYLCVVESNLDTRAVSPSKAVGLWQFMEDTGKRFGLEITPEVDERYHIEKATEAACRYFKEAYGKYGNWPCVAISYNAGMKRISDSLQNQRSDSAFDLWLPVETSRYIFRIMAIKEIFEHPKYYGFVLKKSDLYPQVRTHNVEVTSDIGSLALFAKENGINYMQLREYNVWIRDTKLTVGKGKSYQIAIPETDDLYYNERKVKVYNPAWLQ
ncbi:MAG: lytic transglycosylase domain-containing protein [Dysgonamonadaceae bacterium]|nr:lytic transglycosylase domain-containing protein [Dysgonamonadaceae bacterium]